MSTPIEKIRLACQEAKKNGIEIARGCSFNWTGPNKNKPLTCCALGAVLWQAGLVKGSSNYQFMTDLQALLGVSESWISRFISGFDRNNQILINISKDKDKPKWKKDEVSASAMQIAKEFVTI